MIAKALLYIGIFIIVRAWMKHLFSGKKDEIKEPKKPSQRKYSSKDTFEADYKVVDND